MIIKNERKKKLIANLKLNFFFPLLTFFNLLISLMLSFLQTNKIKEEKNERNNDLLWALAVVFYGLWVCETKKRKTHIIRKGKEENLQKFHWR